MKFSKIIFIFMIVVVTAQGLIIVKDKMKEKKLSNQLTDIRRDLNQAVSENANLRNLVRIKEKKNVLIDERIINMLKKDLVNSSEIINSDGVKGGSMNFYDENGITVLNNRWVVAKFDDGHINGEMLLEYVIDENKKIHWKKIADYIEK